ncbi:formimidoylglutamate deiminase [Nostocoides veronense]|uniref:Formimidoylglutamate deiminase n=1 Tax=Nostocoides veronense TaxID=330836 RepID=A0ABP4XWI5_9MICO
MTTTIWARHAQLPTGMTAKVRITIAGDRIRSIDRADDPRAGDIVLPLVLPGNANGHSHAFHRAIRGRVQDTSGNFWTWRDQMYAAASILNPELYFGLAHAVFVEMVSAGFTAVGEFHYLHHGPEGRPYDNPNAMGEAVIAAAQAAGIRLTLLDTLYLAGGLSGSGHLPLDPVQERFADPDIAAWARRVGDLSDSPGCRIGVAAHSVRAVPREALLQLASVAGPRVIHAHVSEQPAENAASTLVHGLTPTQLFDHSGLLSERFTAVHATHLTRDDIRRLGQARAFICMCPTTERDLADGIGPARRLADAGARITLGSDEHAIIDPFIEARALEMHERLESGERGRFTLDELSVAMSSAGYASIGWPEGGALAPGALADLVAVRRDSVRTVGTRAAQIVYTASAGDVTDVMVGGEFVVRDGTHRAGNPALLLGKALQRLRTA